MRELSLPDLEIVRLLGHGASGSVYLARRTSTGEAVALKHLRAGATETLARARFEREARILQAVSHPAVVRVYELLNIDGEFVLVMQYVPGTTLAHAMPLEPQLVSGVVDELAAALDHVHDAGIVHRDVKPANVLVSDQGDCLLSDFGVARFVEDSMHEARNVVRTKTGTRLGTPAYLAPEIAAGRHDVDRRCDVYSLGVVAYQLLTGALPFRGGVDEVLDAHLHQLPPAPTDIAPGLPPSVNAPLARALAKEPDARFETAGAFARAMSDATDTSWPVLTHDEFRAQLGAIVRRHARADSPHDDSFETEGASLTVMPHLPPAELHVFRPAPTWGRARLALAAAAAGVLAGVIVVLLLNH